MTDNDDPAPPREPPSSDDDGEEDSRHAKRAREHRKFQWTKGDGTAAHIAPTDPEVPSAKRRGAMRRHRSLVGLSAVIIALLSITLMLLYRASLRVGVRESARPAIDDGRSLVNAPRDVVYESTLTRLAPPPPTELGDDATSDNAPAGSASALPKGPAPATSIIRALPF
ncbi:MAG TPA: hypothetical protein VK550_25385 [Polyangiaceae bacterium]|nr:hypothetical protein [Polyangiaceae bacterium]